MLWISGSRSKTDEPMRFRFLAMIGALMLIFAGRSTFGGPIRIDGAMRIGIDVDVGALENNPDIIEVLMQGLSDDFDGFSTITSVGLLQSVLGTPFAVAPAVIDLVVAAMVIIVDEDEEGLLVAEDVEEVFQSLRPILYSELGFIRLVCDDLTVEQRAQIRNTAEASLKHSASKRAVALDPEHAAVVGVLLEARPDPLSSIRQEIDKTMKEVLAAEKYAVYEELSTNRVAHRKRAAILAIVAQLDECLCLTLQQREKIMDAISSHWQDKWEQWLEWSLDFTEIPKSLDPFFRPVLDESQAAVWDQTPKSEPDQGWVFDDEAASRFNDGWWGEVDQMAPDDDGEKEDFPF